MRPNRADKPGRRCLLAAFAGVLLLAGCASDNVSTGRDSQVLKADPALSPEENLQRLASIEAAHHAQRRDDVAIPPGLIPTVLAARDPQNLPTFESLDAVLRQLVPQGDPPGPPLQSTPGPDAATRDEALRHYVRGRDAALQGKADVAVAEFEQALQLDATEPGILKGLAQVYMSRGQAGRAANLYNRMLLLDPDDSEATFTLGLTLAARGRVTDAVGMLGRPFVRGDHFTHDPLADVLAYHALWQAMELLGRDQASIDAAMAVLDVIEDIVQQTRYRQQMTVVHRDRGLMWRAVGDAQCRLGRFEEALAAWTRAAALPAPDPTAVAPRIMYASLRLGRGFTAQQALLDVLELVAGNLRKQEVRLCQYLADHLADRDLASAAVDAMYAEHPGDARFLRAAAALKPDAEAVAMLGPYVRSNPRDLPAVSDILMRLARVDAADAVQLAADLTGAEPMLAESYVQHLIVATPRPTDAIRAVAGLTPSPVLAIVHGRLLAETGGVGRGWAILEDAIDSWPGDLSIRSQQVVMAGMLEEPGLVQEVIDAVGETDSPQFWLFCARTWRQLGQLPAALNAASVGLQYAPESAAMLTELSACHLAHAQALPDGLERQAAAELAEHYARKALRIEPTDEQAHQALLTLFGRGGLLENAARYREAGGELARVDIEGALFGRIAAREAMEQRQFVPALQQLLTLYELDGTDTIALALAIDLWTQMDKPETVVQWLEMKLVTRPGSPALFEQWTVLSLRLGRQEAVLATLRDRQATDPDDFVTRQLLESTLHAMAEFDEAYRLGTQRLQARPAGPRRSMEMAVLAASSKRPDEARGHLLRMLENADPDGGMVESNIQGMLIWRDVAQAFVNAGRVCDAADLLRARIDSQLPLDPSAMSLLATMVIVADAACFDRSVQTIKLLRSLDARGALPVLPWEDARPTLASTMYQAGQIYTIVGDLDGADRIQTQVLELAPDHAMVMNNLGYARLEAGSQDSQTAAWLEKAHELLPDDLSVLDSYAWLRYKQGRYADDGAGPGAATLLKQALAASDEPSPELLDHLGDVYWRLGELEKAIDAWRQAVKLLEDPEKQEQAMDNYMALQTRVWGLLVVDPRAMYHRDSGVLLERTRRKLELAEAGGQPPVAPVFDELGPGQTPVDAAETPGE